MGKLGVIIWSIAATVLAGVGVLIVLISPSLAANEMNMILPAAIVGAVVAVPVSWIVTKKIKTIF